MSRVLVGLYSGRMHEKQGENTCGGRGILKSFNTEVCMWAVGDGDFSCYHQLFCHAVSTDLGSSAECVWIAVKVDFQGK